MFRENVEKGTPLGRKAKTVMDAGDLVSDEIVNEMVRERISRPDCARGFLLDGYPRTLPQAHALEEILQREGRPTPLVVDLKVGYDVIVARLAGRRICPACHRTYNLNLQPPAKAGVCDEDGTPLQQRADDREEAIRGRLSAYEAQTSPLEDFYRGQGRFHEINADQSPEQITVALSRIFDAS